MTQVDASEPRPDAATDAPQEPDILIEQVAGWLMAEALGDTTVAALFEGCCNRLYGAGVSLLRAHISYRTLHPLYVGIGMTWWRDRALSVDNFPRSDEIPVGWLQSPYHYMIERRVPTLRRHLSGSQAQIDFPILEDLQRQGATDYLADIVTFDDAGEDGIIGSWVTDRDGGFTDREIDALQRIRQYLAVVIKLQTRGDIARNVMTTYLGPVAGLRVLEGQIQRGDGEVIRAAIWYSDLRGSTAMAEQLSQDDYIEVLNQFFDSTGGAVVNAGGEILGFLGDAVLAIFPIAPGETSPQAACQRAVEASKDARVRLAAVNQALPNRPTLHFGLGLHFGDVVFGNIGVPERLTFSVIGSVVNEVSRIEALTKVLDEPVLASGQFVDAVAAEWQSLGEHELRGVTERFEILAPANAEDR